MNNKYSFKELLENSIIIDFEKNISVIFNKIEIPMIQRDYAQGRGKVEGLELKLNETGKRFVDSIFESLSQNKDMVMDFVYGSISEFINLKSKEKEYTFIPLDGQQRLTTLFLLYWYIGSRELKNGEHTKLMTLLKKFTYSTRTSSRRFCEQLCETTLSFDKTPSIELSNLFWFFKSYKKDPTITAMLNMLDVLHEKYRSIGNPSLLRTLEKLQFYILPLDGFNLTEDLYIKMNARGKQLTDFENFKADLIKWMKDASNPDNLKFEKDVEYDGRTMQYYMSISQKIDNEWTNMFWRLTKDRDDKIVDPLFMRFFYRYFLNRYILLSKTDIKSIEKEDDFKYFASESAYQNFNAFNKLLSYNEISNLEISFDTLSKNWNEIYTSISPSWYKSNERYSFWDNSITQIQRIVFLAITLYVETNETFDIIKFRQWMRIVWNIVGNTDITDYSSAIGVMNLLSELSRGCSNVYQYLANKQTLILSSASKNAIEEEKWKCRFIYSNSQFNQDWENTFLEAEKHMFFKGSVSFLMTDIMGIDDFKHRNQLAGKVFDEKGVNEKYREAGHFFLRALISRYSDYNQIIWRNFTDLDESEHYLKKMLASDEVVRNATREWFSLKNEGELNKKLIEECKKDSQIIVGWDINNPETLRRIKKVHEDLYKKEDLQNWIQHPTHKAIRLGWRSDKLYISRPSAWYDWILLDGYRNEIITKLITEPYSCSTNNQCSLDENKIPYFWGNGEISLSRKVTVNNEDFDFEYNFDAQIVKVGIRETEELKAKLSNVQFGSEVLKGWICAITYDYQKVSQESAIDDFINKIESEIFGEKSSLVLKIRVAGNKP